LGGILEQQPAAIEGAVRLADFKDRFPAETRPAQADDIVSDDNGFTMAHHERGHVHVNASARSDKGQTAYPDELVNQRVSPENGPVLGENVAGQQGAVLHLDALAQLAVVSGVGGAEEDGLVADDRGRFGLGAAMNAGALAHDHSVTQPAVAALAL